MATGVLSGRSFEMPMSGKTTLSAHVFSAVRVNSIVTLSPRATVTELGSNPCAPTDTLMTLPAAVGAAPFAGGAAVVSDGGGDLHAAAKKARAKKILNCRMFMGRVLVVCEPDCVPGDCIWERFSRARWCDTGSARGVGSVAIPSRPRARTLGMSARVPLRVERTRRRSIAKDAPTQVKNTINRARDAVGEKGPARIG